MRILTISLILLCGWQDRETEALCGEGTNLRRLSLDLIGRIPTKDELDAHLADPSGTVDRLLASDDFARFWSEVWSSMLVGYTRRRDRNGLTNWLRTQFDEDRPFDEMATALVTKSEPGTGGFLDGIRFNPAVKVSQIFLGIRLDCATCHDHPFAQWTQEDFLNMNRFFEVSDDQLFGKGGTDDLSKKPRFLTGAQPVTRKWREELALYMRRSRPFALNFANRLWYHMLGRGIVHPPDDFNDRRRASDPKLLNRLADAARDSGWDIKALLRRIARSKSYRLATGRHRMLKPLTPQQFYDSLTVALGRLPLTRGEFIQAFTVATVDVDYTNTWEYRESVQQLMRKLSMKLPVPDVSIEELYQRLLTRKPTPRERKLCGGREKKDIVFALVNSSEFFWNH